MVLEDIDVCILPMNCGNKSLHGLNSFDFFMILLNVMIRQAKQILLKLLVEPCYSSVLQGSVLAHCTKL